MADLDRGVESNAVHIPDCRIWAEIYYLDSPTDYREYLAQGGMQPRESYSDLVMLEDSKHLLTVYGISLRSLVAGIVLILASGYLLYSLRDVF
jgi:hypothetical protein